MTSPTESPTVSARRLAAIGLLTLCGVWTGCSDDAPPSEPGGFNNGGSGGAAAGASGSGNGASGGNAGAGNASGAGGSGAESGSAGSGAAAGSGGSGGGAACNVEFRYRPEAGTTVTTVAVAGEWNNFDETVMLLTGPDPSGAYSGAATLPPGTHGYKLVLDGSNWQLDPEQGYRKYVNGVENSAVRVLDCAKPRLSTESSSATRPAVNQGVFTAKLNITRAASGAAPASVTATRKHAGTTTPLSSSQAALSGDSVDISIDTLPEGKHTIVVTVKDADGAVSELERLVFWIEADEFSWRDALIYMVMTDRFRDGDSSNNAPPNAGVQDPRADFMGGDLQGLTERIADGTLDQLGVRAIWLSPWQTNPAGSYIAADGFHQVTGYHGYWPVKAREVDPRLGGEAALRALVKTAHEHGIRILMDYVVNHVHSEHEYFKDHPNWFRTGCVCGTSGCDWTAQRLECLFADYLPDINWSVPEAGQQFEDDAIWWLDEFDLDGLRVDAVKHVEDAAITNVSTRVREEFEAAGTQYFLMGETAMGWSDCGIACNQDQYGTISRYLGRHGLTGQFDFVLYHAVPYRVFAHDDQGMLHADFWTQASLSQYPSDSIMTPFIGSHDSTRFTSMATYRGQPGYDRGIAGNQWDNVAGPPPDGEPLRRHAAALGWLFGLPGAPLLYYGDEYGEWGGADPGNRAMWRGDSGSLSSDEQFVLDQTRKLGAARRELVALRRGNYRSLYATEDFLAFARETDNGDVAIVAVSKSGAALSESITLPASIGLAGGTALTGRISGASSTVVGNTLSVSLPARGVAILAKP